MKQSLYFLSYIILMFPGFAKAMVVDKLTEIHFVFYDPKPFHVQTEYEECSEISATARYSYSETKGSTKEYFPHLNKDNQTLKTPCSPNDSRGDFNDSQKIADILNSSIVQTSPYGVYELVVTAKYHFSQDATPQSIKMREVISFDHPGVQAPIKLKNLIDIPFY